jgi:hypothetical protein
MQRFKVNSLGAPHRIQQGGADRALTFLRAEKALLPPSMAVGFSAWLAYASQPAEQRPGFRPFIRLPWSSGPPLLPCPAGTGHASVRPVAAEKVVDFSDAIS